MMEQIPGPTIGDISLNCANGYASSGILQML